MPLQVRKIGELEELNTFLRGGIIGGKDIRRGIQGLLDGKTLTFTSPAGVVTFVSNPAGEQIPMTVKEILDQINAVIAGYAKLDSQGRLVVEDPSAAVAVVLDVSASTAASLLGFSSNLDHTGKIYNPPGGAAPALIDVSLDPLGGGTYLLTTEEA